MGVCATLLRSYENGVSLSFPTFESPLFHNRCALFFCYFLQEHQRHISAHVQQREGHHEHIYHVVSTQGADCDEKKNSDRFLILITLGVLWIVPFGGTHLLEYYRVRYWGVVGSLRERFQIMLLKKFLNYTVRPLS